MVKTIGWKLFCWAITIAAALAFTISLFYVIYTSAALAGLCFLGQWDYVFGTLGRLLGFVVRLFITGMFFWVARIIANYEWVEHNA